MQRPILLLDDGGALVGQTADQVAEAARRSGAAGRSGADAPERG
ncbi:hypothetical protein [Micromonospora deserti]|nr:hypothetical protein [Micromonospora deserti]